MFHTDTEFSSLLGLQNLKIGKMHIYLLKRGINCTVLVHLFLFSREILSPDIFIVELGYTLHATEKSDVYSFGIVLLELLTCRSPTDPQFDHNKDLVSWAKKHHLNQDLSEILDPRVSTYAQDDMRKIMEIAVRCTNESPSLRPTMVEVVNMLIDACPRVLVEDTK